MSWPGDEPGHRTDDRRAGPVEVPAEPMVRLGVPGGGSRFGRRSPSDHPERPPLVSPAVEALVAAVGVVLLLPTVGALQREALQRSGPGFVVGVVLSVAVAGAVAGMAHRWLGGGRRRHAAAVGTVAGLLAATAFGDVALHSGGLGEVLPRVPALRPAALALVVLALRVSGRPSRVLGACGGVATAMAVVGALQVGSQLVSSYLPSSSAGQQSAAPEETMGPAPGPPPGDGGSPTFGDLCHPDELELSVGAAVPAGHDVATTITATNVGDRTCEVREWPSVQLFSAGEDLGLFVHVAQVDPLSGEHVEPDPVWLAPGTSAQTQVWWPSWGAAADLTVEQRLHLGVGGGTEVVGLDPSQRWDVVRAAEAWVAPWQPAR